MNQRHLWTTVAAQTIITLSVFCLPSIGRTQASEGIIPASQASSTSDAVKVGEYQSSTAKPISDTVITRIYPHSVKGLQAATLYVRDIPVITFLGSGKVTNKETKVGVIGNNQDLNSSPVAATNSTKVASSSNAANTINFNKQVRVIDNEPVYQASLIAARINKLVENNVDASKITVSWKKTDNSPISSKAQKPGLSTPESSPEAYIIEIDGQELVEINQATRLADTTQNLAQDALQATNRLRRLLGQAPAIKEIANLPIKPVSKPKRSPQIALANVKLSFQGIASWYGYDGSGSKTASGERYYPEGLTAAHRSLPLGTKIRVTNTRNGRSVVVRINDRGPYIRGRILDVSAGAARILGMIGSGIAPINLEVLGR